MKIKYFKKYTSLILSLAILISFSTSCSDKSWILKADTESVPIGVYIYYVYNSLLSAAGKVEDTSKSPLKQNIKGSSIDESSEDEDIDEENVEEDTQEQDVTSQEQEADQGDSGMSAKQWILDSALGDTKNVLSVNMQLNELGVELTDDELTEAQITADKNWVYYSKTLKNCGVSQSSYQMATSIYDAKYDKLLGAIYDQDGTQAVSNEEVESYFLDKYVDYEYFSKSLKNKDDEGNSTDMSEEEIAAVEAQFQEYANRINNGETIETIANEYTESSDLSESPLVSDPVESEDISVSSEVKTKFEEMENNHAIAYKSSSSYYLMYKNDINDSLKKVTKGSEVRTEILKKLKKDDLDKLIVDYADSIYIEINFSAIRTYTPAMVEKKTSSSSKKSSSSSSSS